MERKLFGRALLALSMMALLGSSAGAVATLNITGGAVYTASNALIKTTAITPTLVTGGINADFQSAFNSWNNEAGNAKGWTLNNGGALPNGTIFDITTYTAKAAGNVGSLEININYTPAAGAPPRINGNGNNTLESNEAAWSQSVLTNQKLAGSLPGNPYLDNPAGIGGIFPAPLYPFQYVDSHFYDEPSRVPDADWEAVAYISTANFNTKILTVYDGVKWGFSVRAVPEPGTVALMVLGGAGLLGSAVIKRRKVA